MTSSEVRDRVLEIGCDTLVISGGEPLLQVDFELLRALSGFELHLETNGSLSLGALLDEFDHISMSPKQCVEKTKLERCDDLKLLYPSISDPGIGKTCRQGKVYPDR